MGLKQTYSKELDYIHSYWDKITFSGKPPLTLGRNLFLRLGHIDLPFPVVSPNHKYFAGTEYYWDSYFILLGLYDDKRFELAAGLIENQLFLFDQFGIILARNSKTSFGRSQPPFLTSMINERRKQDKTVSADWLERAYRTAAHEYEKVWCSIPRLNGRVGLSHYHPRWLPEILGKFECGWDLSSRFVGLDDHLIPIDLNCLLYKYETDLEAWAAENGRKDEARKWKTRAAQRKLAIDQHLWDETKGFYFDYYYGHRSHRELKSLAAYFALWSGVASKEQAKRCVEQLDVFLKPGGLANTEPLEWKHRQWDYPNGWPNLQFIVIEGLLNYGYRDEAEQVALRWLRLNSQVFKKTGAFWEKYDVVRGRPGLSGRYPTQPGFSWTNAVFSRLCTMFDGA